MNIADLSIMEIRAHLEKLDEVSSDLLESLQNDPRKGVQELARQYRARMEHQARLHAQWIELNRYEQMFRQQGKSLIVGIDEVGRGPLAGPVVAAAVALPEHFYLPGLNDSKKVPEHLREAYYEVIVRDALAIGIGVVEAARIDQINILEATKEAMRLAVTNTGLTPDVCLIDAVQLADIPYEQLPIIGGDGKSASIAAASIVAKVTRDRMMKELAKQYPPYGFEKNAGYGTAEHLQALERYGPSPVHRLTFGGVKERA